MSELPSLRASLLRFVSFRLELSRSLPVWNGMEWDGMDWNGESGLVRGLWSWVVGLNDGGDDDGDDGGGDDDDGGGGRCIYICNACIDR